MATFIGFCIAAVLGFIIAGDAKERGMNAFGWGFFTFMIAIIAIPIYLIVRRPRIQR